MHTNTPPASQTPESLFENKLVLKLSDLLYSSWVRSSSYPKSPRAWQTQTTLKGAHTQKHKKRMQSFAPCIMHASFYYLCYVSIENYIRKLGTLLPELSVHGAKMIPRDPGWSSRFWIAEVPSLYVHYDIFQMQMWCWNKTPGLELWSGRDLGKAPTIVERFVVTRCSGCGHVFRICHILFVRACRDDILNHTRLFH